MGKRGLEYEELLKLEQGVWVYCECDGNPLVGLEQK